MDSLKCLIGFAHVGIVRAFNVVSRMYSVYRIICLKLLLHAQFRTSRLTFVAYTLWRDGKYYIRFVGNLILFSAVQKL